MKSRLTCIFVVMLFVLTGLGAGSQAQELFGVGTDFENGAPAGVSARLVSPSSLYSIDPDTGAVTFIGDIGADDCRGLDFHPITNKLFAVCFDVFLDELVLLEVNVLTGSGKFIGIVDPDIEFFRELTDMSFRSDGVLFANFRSKPSDLIVIIDTDTAETTILGEIGLNFSVGGLGFSLTDLLFYAGDDIFMPLFALYEINQTNGNADFLTDLIFGSPERLIVESLDTNTLDGVLFAAYQQLGPGSILATINTNNGQVNDIGPTGDITIRAIAFPNPIVRNIPTMSQYGLVLAAVVLLAAALLFLRRRSFKSNA